VTVYAEEVSFIQLSRNLRRRLLIFLYVRAIIKIAAVSRCLEGVPMSEVSTKPFDSRYAFGVFLDNLLEQDGLQTPRQTKALLFLYAVLYEGVIVSDSWLMTCRGLRAMLQQPDAEQLFACGGLVPLLRDTAKSYTDFFETAREKRLHALIDDPAFMSKLDAMTKNRVVSFNLGQISSAYTAMSKQVLSADVLLALGATAETVATVQRIGIGDTNSHVKDVICPAIADPVQSQLVMDAARAPYSLNIPVNLGSSIAGPNNYEGHKVLAAMRGPKRNLAGVDIISPKNVASQLVYSATITDAQVHWMLREETLAAMTAEDMAELRSHAERKPYLSALANYLTTPDRAHWEPLAVALENYLSKAANTLIHRWMQTNRFGEELRDGEVNVLADGSLRIEAPNKPVEMSGVAMVENANKLPEAATDLCIVGRTITVPELTPQKG
jgi:hypothetical protein